MNDPVLTPKTMQEIALDGVGEQVRLQRRIAELEGFLRLLIEDKRLSPFTREGARILLAKRS